MTPQLVIRAYRQGIFPMASGRHGQVDWYCPKRRGVLPLDRFHVPRNLRRRVRQSRFRITMDLAFDRVIRACSEPRPDSSETWINDQIIVTYGALHQAGLAHSVEAWVQPDPADGGYGAHERLALAGGLYGVALGGVFFGESMFTSVTDASKVCLVHLIEHLRWRRFALLDTQYITAHLQQFGAIELDRPDYLDQLDRALRLNVSW